MKVVKDIDRHPVYHGDEPCMMMMMISLMQDLINQIFLEITNAMTITALGGGWPAFLWR